jgi:hypothetical protein
MSASRTRKHFIALPTGSFDQGRAELGRQGESTDVVSDMPMDLI